MPHTTPLSETFRLNFLFWKIFGLWPGKKPTKYYKYYSALYLIPTLFIYNILISLNLLYAPRKIEMLIPEVTFYFTEFVVSSKVLMILVMRNKILAAFKILDCELFKGDGDTGREIIQNTVYIYKTYWKSYMIFCHIGLGSQVLVPVIMYWILKTDLDLPICQYYFLSDEIRTKYFVFWFVYQTAGMYGHMVYNVNVDSFIAGLIMMAITQMKVINHKLTHLKLNATESTMEMEAQEKIQGPKLTDCLRYYDLILSYCSSVQKIITVTMFIQFAMAAVNICVVMCVLLLPTTTETLIFLVIYLIAIMCQIFIPSWLGTQLSYESQELVNAAYSSEWIPRSEAYKRSLRLLIMRANTPIVFSGLKMFPLSLGVFTSIMKTAYSFFTLVRNVQESQELKN